jgi:hypothetical protein
MRRGNKIRRSAWLIIFLKSISLAQQVLVSEKAVQALTKKRRKEHAANKLNTAAQATANARKSSGNNFCESQPSLLVSTDT